MFKLLASESKTIYKNDFDDTEVSRISSSNDLTGIFLKKTSKSRQNLSRWSWEWNNAYFIYFKVLLY